MACGWAVADSNTGRLALGEQGRRVGFALDPETITITAGQRSVEWPAASPALRWLRYAPAPLGTVVMVGEALLSIYN